VETVNKAKAFQQRWNDGAESLLTACDGADFGKPTGAKIRSMKPETRNKPE
jgi:hypothetical protein